MLTCGVKARIGHGILRPATNQIVFTQLQDPRDYELINESYNERIRSITKERFETFRENVRRVKDATFPDPGPLFLFIGSDLPTKQFIEMGKIEDILTPYFIDSLKVDVSYSTCSLIPHTLLQQKTILVNTLIVGIGKTTIKAFMLRLVDWFKKPSIPGLIIGITLQFGCMLLPKALNDSVITMKVFTHPNSSKFHHEKLKSHFEWPSYKTIGLQNSKTLQVVYFALHA